MRQAAVLDRDTQARRLPDHRCPTCGMPAPALLAVLPSGRRVLVEACAICGRQEATPVDVPDAKGPPRT